MRRALILSAIVALSAAGLTSLAQVSNAAPVTTAVPSGDAHTHAAQAAAELVAGRAPALHTSTDDTFVQHPVISSKEGLQYVPYDRKYKGLKVYGGDFVVVTNSAGQVLSTSTAQKTTITLASTTATVTAARAATIAKSQQHATVDKLAVSTLGVYALGTPKLAWETVVLGHNGAIPSKLHVFVDATTGQVLSKYDEVSDGTGNAAINGGSVAIATSGSGTSFTMNDPTRPGISCRNFTGHAVLSGSDDLWGNGVGTNLETGCVDALYSVQHEWSMLSAWLGRNGINGSGSGFPIYMGLNDENAYWDGTSVSVGHNTAGAWIGSMDVVGHEFGHAIDSNTPGGQSSNGVSEGTGDIFGALTEWYANNTAYDPPDYSVGEEVNLVGSGPIRYMYNPSLVGDPNCYSSSIPSAETHAAAGPLDHWFVLLAQGSAASGGQPASPTCNGSSVSGLGIQTAGRIFYNAMLTKTTGMTYLKYRTATLNAVKNLFPGSCAQFAVVKAAWDAISVPAQAADPTCSGGVTVSNPGPKTGTVGTPIGSFSLTATPAGTYTWSATGLPPGITINATSGVVSGTPTTSGSYAPTVTASGTSGAGSAGFAFTISGSGGGTCTNGGQKLLNPGFETTGGWSSSAGVISNTSTGDPARTGTKLAYLDGYGTTHTDTLTQSVAVPTGCSSYVFSFYLRIITSETTTTVAYDKLTVKSGATTLASYSNLNKNTAYELRTFVLSGVGGTTVPVSFTGVEDSSLQTSFLVDDTAFNVS